MEDHTTTAALAAGLMPPPTKKLATMGNATKGTRSKTSKASKKKPKKLGKVASLMDIVSRARFRNHKSQGDGALLSRDGKKTQPKVAVQDEESILLETTKHDLQVG